MSTAAEAPSVAGIHVQYARDVLLQAGGDIVAGDKTTINNYYGAKPRDIAKSPYKFLSYYDIGDRDIFFGRDAVIEELAGEIQRHKVVIINGQSGSGKTSLLNAGIIPRLAENGYLYVYFRDYSQPIEQLRAFFRDNPSFGLTTDRQLSLLQILRTVRHQGRQVVFIFDQFERFFVNVEPGERQRFFEEIKSCLETDLSASELSLVFSLRDDFFGKLLLEAEATMPAFGTDSYHHNLRPLSCDEARQAILGPLKAIRNVFFDRQFVDSVLIHHLVGEASGVERIEPPHLQIVCNKLYEEACARFHKRGNDEPFRIGSELYQELGETQGMLRNYLDDVVAEITDGDVSKISIVRSALKLMIETVGTRKFASLDDISGGLPDAPQAETVTLIGRLQESRILETKQAADRIEYSLSHEFMVAKVQSWFDEREMLRRKAQETLQRALAEQAVTPDSVLNETQVKSIRKWLSTESLDAPAILLVKNSLLAIRREKQRIRRGTKQALEHARRLEISKRRTKIAVFTGLVVAAILTVVSVGFGIWGSRNAEAAHTKKIEAEKLLATSYLANGREELRGGSYERAVAWFGAAYQTANTSEHEPLASSARTLIGGWSPFVGRQLPHDETPYAVAYSPDGKTIITGGFKKARLWDSATGMPRGDPLAPVGWVKYVAFSPDSTTAITITDEAVAQRWNVATGEAKGKAQKHPQSNKVLAVSKDARTILTSGQSTWVWEIEAGPASAKRLPFRPDSCAAFSPDGRFIAVCFLSKLNVWDLESGGVLKEDVALDLAARVVAFSPDGETICVGGRIFGQNSVGARQLGSAQLLKRSEGKVYGTLPHDYEVTAIAFSFPNGDRVVTGSGNDGISGDGSTRCGWARVWDCKTATALTKPLDHGQPVVAVAFSPDNQTVAYAGSTPIGMGDPGEVRLWDATTGRPRRGALRHDDVITAMAFSPDGGSLITGGIDMTARIWDVAVRVPRRAAPPDENTSSVAILSIGGSVAIDTSCQLKNKKTGEFIGKKLVDFDGEPSSTMIATDGQTAVLGYDEQNSRDMYKVRLWNVITGQPQGEALERYRVVENHLNPCSVGLSRDGRIAFAESLLEKKSEVRFWSITSGQPLGTALRYEPPDPIMALAFDPSKRTILTGGGAGQLWDVQTWIPVGPPIEEDSAYVAYCENGKGVVTNSASTGGGAESRLWRVGLPAQDDLKRLMLSVAVRTMHQIDAKGSLHPLSLKEWLKLKVELDDLGKPCDIVD